MKRFLSLVLILVLVGFGCGERTLKNKTIYDAAKSGNLKELKIYIERGAPINVHDAKKETPLTYAVGKGDLEIVRYLVRKGADVNARGECDWTPLIYAASGSHLDVIIFLLGNGANLESKDQWGRTSLMQAAMRGHKETIELLLANGGNIFARDNTGDSALTLAIDEDNQGMLEFIADKLNASKNQEIIANGINETNRLELDWAHNSSWGVNQRDNSMQTPLMKAANQGNIKAVEFLLNRQANVNAADYRGRTPLTEAVMNGNPEVIKILLENGVDINASFDNGPTALMLAAGEDFAKYTEIANITSRVFHKHPIHYNQLEVVKMLVTNGANVNKRVERVVQSKIAMHAIDGAEIPIQDEIIESMSALQYALKAGKTNVVQYLKDHGAIE